MRDFKSYWKKFEGIDRSKLFRVVSVAWLVSVPIVFTLNRINTGNWEFDLAIYLFLAFSVSLWGIWELISRN